MTVIKRQTILSTIYSYLGVGIGTITQALIIPNFFTTEENGLLQILFSYMLIICQIASLGFNSAGTKYFSKFRSPEKKHNGFLFWALLINLLGFIICSILLLIFKDEIVKSKTGNSELFKTYYYLLFPISLSTILFNVFDNYTKLLLDTVYSSFLSQFFQRLLIFFATLLVVFHIVQFPQFIYFWLFAICFPTVLMFLRAVELDNFSLKPKNDIFKDIDFRRQFISFAIFASSTSISSMVITQLDKLMVHKYLGLGNTGIYGTALLFGSVMSMSYNATIKASTGIVLDAMEMKDYEKVSKIYTKSSITQLIFGSFILLLVWINIDELFSFIKPEYSIGKSVLIIIGIGKLIDLATGINALILAYSKYYKLDSALMISFILVLVILNHQLIPQFQLKGAAIAALISIIYYNFSRTFFVWRFFKLQPFGIEQLKIVALLIILIWVGLKIPTFKFIHFSSLINISIKSMIIGTLFIVGIWNLKVSDEINGLISKMLRIFRRK